MPSAASLLARSVEAAARTPQPHGHRQACEKKGSRRESDVGQTCLASIVGVSAGIRVARRPRLIHQLPGSVEVHVQDADLDDVESIEAMPCRRCLVAAVERREYSLVREIAAHDTRLGQAEAGLDGHHSRHLSTPSVDGRASTP